MSLARRHQTYREAVAVSRDRDMRADILRIAAMEATIRLMASVGPVGELDIAARFDMSMVEAYRLLNRMVAEGKIRALARKHPYWLEHHNARENESIQPTNGRERFMEPFWNYFESLSWKISRLPENFRAITSDNYRRKLYYGGEEFERHKQEFRREWQLGTIKAFIRGREIQPAAAVDPTSLINDPDLVFQASTLIAKWPAGGARPKPQKDSSGPDRNAALPTYTNHKRLEPLKAAIRLAIEKRIFPATTGVSWDQFADEVYLQAHPETPKTNGKISNRKNMARGFSSKNVMRITKTMREEDPAFDAKFPDSRHR
jgi:hypothetical protein